MKRRKLADNLKCRSLKGLVSSINAGSFSKLLKRTIFSLTVFISVSLLTIKGISYSGTSASELDKTSYSATNLPAVISKTSHDKSFSDLSYSSFSPAPLPAPQDGDYQTRATGNWSANTTWQVRVAGAWVNCAPGDYPGASAGAGTVWINSGHVVTLNVNPANPVAGITFVDGTTAATTLILTGRTLNVTGDVIFSTPAADAGDQTITLGTGTLNCASIFMPATADPSYDIVITISTGRINATGNIRMDGGSDRNNITFTGGGRIYVGGDFTGGGFTCATSLVYYNGTDQQVGSYTYYRLYIEGGGTKTLLVPLPLQIF